MSNARPVCVLFALPEEMRPFERRTGSSGLHLKISCSGVGMANAAKSAESLLSEKAAALIVCGFGGGLALGLAGDIMVADRVITGQNELLCADSALLAAAKSIAFNPSVFEWLDPDIHVGTLFTHDRVLVTSQEKRELAARTGAIAVDMETAGAVRVAEEHGIPWLAVRAITDTAKDDLPLDFNALANPDGSINRSRVVLATLANPRKIPALMRLGRNSALAANNLAAFLLAFLQALPETK